MEKNVEMQLVELKSGIRKMLRDLDQSQRDFEKVLQTVRNIEMEERHTTIFDFLEGEK